MRLPIVGLDSIGILSDANPHDLPVNAWSSGKNVVFVEGRIEKAKGYQVAFTPEHDAYWLHPVRSPDGYYWLLAGDTAVYNQNGGVLTNITRDEVGPYSADGQMWTGGSLNGVPVLNNPNDEPQMWLPATQDTLLTALQNWPSEWRAQSLRPFLNYLVALGTNKGGDPNPFRVNWSHVADPGQVPSSWDITDPTKDAGEVVLADSDGSLVDQCPLGRLNILYKTDKVYAMQHIGGIDIFAFPPILTPGLGLLVPNGVVAFNNANGQENHFVFGPNDVYVHNGQTSQQLLRKRMRKWLYNNIDPTYYVRSYVVHNIDQNEIWLCFPETGSTLPNLALVWHYKDNTTTIRELPDAAFMQVGRVVELQGAVASDTWDNAVGTWDTDNAPWGYGAYSAVGSRLLMVTHGTERNGYVQDTGTQFHDEPIHAYVERIGLSVLGKDWQGRPIYDSDVVKIVTEVWPRVKADVGTVMYISLGTQMTENDPIEWTEPMPFVVGTDEKVNPYVSGKILSIRFEVTSSTHWQLSGYDMEIKPGGSY